MVHLAARAGVRGSFEDAGRYSDINVTGTAVVLEAASALAVPRLIFASSSSVYGSAGTTPFSERDGSYDQMLWMGLKKEAAYLPGC